MWGFNFIDGQENHSFLPIIVEGRDVTRYYFSVMQSYGELPESKRATEPPFLLCHKHSFLCPGLFLMPAFYQAPCSPAEKQNRVLTGWGRVAWRGWQWPWGYHVIHPSWPWVVKHRTSGCMPAIAPLPSRLVHGCAPPPPAGLGWQLKAWPVFRNRRSVDGADALFWFDYLGPLQNHLERETVSKWQSKNNKVGKNVWLTQLLWVLTTLTKNPD